MPFLDFVSNVLNEWYITKSLILSSLNCETSFLSPFGLWVVVQAGRERWYMGMASFQSALQLASSSSTDRGKDYLYARWNRSINQLCIAN